MTRFVRGARLAPFLLVLIVAAGCGESEETPTAPTTVDNTATQQFNDTIGANQARTHAFSSGSGTMTVTLTTVAFTGGVAEGEPTGSDTALGLSLGTWDGAACQLVVTNDNARQGITVVGQAASSGNFCVRVYDVGGLTAPVTVDYVVEVLHRAP